MSFTIARKTAWVESCEARIGQLVNYRWPIEPGKHQRMHDREIRRWRR